MSKSPRKGAAQKLRPAKHIRPPSVGGKNFKAYNFKPFNRRLSIADSTLSESSDGTLGKHRAAYGLDSESSLTAMSEEDETRASRKGLVFFEPSPQPQRGKTIKAVAQAASKSTAALKALSRPKRNSRSGKGSSSRKQLGGKSFRYGQKMPQAVYDLDLDELLDLDLSQFAAADDSDDLNESDESLSSLGDLDVDYVRLQAEARMRKLQTAKGEPARPRRDSTKAKPDFEFDFPKPVEEDIGEEVPEDPAAAATGNFEFHFDKPLMDVPKIKEEELNLEEEYEFDDNALLATLQADNDMDDFITTPQAPNRQGLVSSMNEDAEDDFLREEERYLVNEFETNGFDDDAAPPVLLDTPDHGYLSLLESEQLTLEDGYVDFDLGPHAEPQDSTIKPRRRQDSEDEDDLYLWNYFFSSDAASDSEYDEPILEDMRLREDDGYDSSELTDVDLSLPSGKDGVGLKVAQEVLSLRTADYRPPVLGTWAAIDSKPFGIIDGLLTRTLHLAKNPRTNGWPAVEELQLDLEELLNVSELDADDENDVRIWRDFNENKKHVPLGAFRNKNQRQPVLLAEPMFGARSTPYSRRGSQVKAKLALRSPARKLRRALLASAATDGYRSTKLGLFSENVLADVQEVLGDDKDFMALVGL